MDTPQFLNFADHAQGSKSETGSLQASRYQRIALVAALAACVLVGFAIQPTSGEDQTSPELVGAIDSSAPAASNAAGARPAQSPAESRVPGQYMQQAGTNYGRVANEVASQLAPTAPEYYFPARYTNQARSNDGNVMTYEHD